MKKILTLAAMALTLFACTKEPNGPQPPVLPDGEALVSFQIRTPASGPMTLAGTPDSDALAMKGEAQVSNLLIYVFAPAGATGTTDDYRLEGVFGPYQGDVSDATTIGAVINIDNIRVKVGDIKHFYFVANYQLPVSHSDVNFTETQMIQQIMNMGGLPYVDHSKDPLEVEIAPADQIYGIPMSAFAEVDCTSAAGLGKPSNGSLNGDVELKRAVARYDVANHTLNFRVLAVQAHAFDSAYVMDTTSFLQLPANVFAADYLASPLTLDNAQGPRLYDWYGNWFDYPKVVFGDGGLNDADPNNNGIHPRRMVDGGKLNMDNPVATPGNPDDDALSPALPIAAGYLFPTPGKTTFVDDSMYVTVYYEEFIDTGNETGGGAIGDGDLDGVRDSWSGDTLALNVAFKKTDVYQNVARNHVYRITLHEDPYLTAEFEIKEWENSSAVLPLQVVVPTTLKFSSGGGTGGVFTQEAGQTKVTFPAEGGTFTVRINTDGVTPISNGTSLPSWVEVNDAQDVVFTPSGSEFTITFTVAPHYETNTRPQWVNGRNTVVYVSLNGQDSKPTSSFQIIQGPAIPEP